MKRNFFFSLLLFSTILAFSQEGASTVGERPYELSESAVSRKSTFDFMNIDKWQIVSPTNCDVELTRTSEQIATVPFSGKIEYETKQQEASFFVSLKEPISLDEAWDCLDIWTFGDHWLWGEPASHTAMQAYAVVEDSYKRRHEVNLVQSGYAGMVHKYWMLNHVKFPQSFSPNAKFLGIKFKGNNTDVGVKHNLYLSSGYLYKEELSPLTFKPFPNELPFPLRKETILPSNFSEYQNKTVQTKNSFQLSYKGKDGELTYAIDKSNPLGDIVVLWNNKTVQTINNRKLILADNSELSIIPAITKIQNDTIWFNANILWQKENIPLDFFYTVRQKSLIIGIEQKGNEGFIKEIHSGEIHSTDNYKVVVPFLKYNNSDRPTILVNSNLFTFIIYDFYYTHASSFSVGNPNAKIPFSGGKTIYVSKTDGKRNPVRDKLFITVSPNVQEVLPTIDNPPSPMRSMQADRLWAINGGSDLDKLGRFVSDLRNRGVEKVSIRYHEDFWREGGESYTFRLTPNPQLGIKKIQDYIQFVKSNDWRVGLYTNYTDMATVNSLFDPDWIKQGSSGEWEVSWSRCYSPKPQIAWEQEAILAPQIGKLYNTNHSYCDVHTAVAPSTRVDYDYRVPDAGMMRGVINRYGMLLMNERKAYGGPVYSEGGNHWWYAGLVDGNYANDDLEQLPVFPDFQLLKIHPLQMDAGNRGKDYAYIAYTFAYGNIGILSEGIDAIRRYAFLQPVQDEYVMRNVKSIEYADVKGVLFNSSQAVIKKILEKPRLKIVYETGLEMFINFNEKEWDLTINSDKIKLPQFGFYVYNPKKKLLSSSFLANKTSKRLDKVVSPELLYINTHGENSNENLGGRGEYLLKKEKFGWEIIPFSKETEFNFSLSLLGFESAYSVQLRVLNDTGSIIELRELLVSDNKVQFTHDNNENYKYRLAIVE